MYCIKINNRSRDRKGEVRASVSKKEYADYAWLLMGCGRLWED